MDEADAQATDQPTEPAAEPAPDAQEEAATAEAADDGAQDTGAADSDAAGAVDGEPATTEPATTEPATTGAAQDAEAGPDADTDADTDTGADAAAETEAEDGSADDASAEEGAAEAGDDAALGENGEAVADSQAGEGGEALDGADADGVEAGLDAAADAAPETVNALEPILNLVEAGGPIIVLLAALSVISLALVVVKLVQFRILRVAHRGFVTGVADQLHRGETRAALEAVQARRGVVARVMEAAIRGQLLTNDEERVREEVTRVAQMKMDGMERGLPLLSLIATISPLLGLLGTVLGMIDAFQQLQDAGDRVDPAILSGGIWEALLTTAAGLSVAIPAAAFYTWLQRSVDVCAQYMEDAATQVFTAPLYRESATAEAERADAA